MRIGLLRLGVGCLMLWMPLAGADDWPQWRGPMRDGVWREEGPPERLPTELSIRWRAPVGAGWASPVIADGRVYVADSELKEPVARERLLCFDQATGELLWTFSEIVSYPDWAFAPDQNAGPTASPAVADGRVYFLGGNGAMRCLVAATGEMVWRNDLAKTYEVSVLQCRASPLVDGGQVILQVGGKPGAGVVALDCQTGAELWKALDEPVSNSSPVIITAGGQRQLIVWTGASVSSLDPSTGALWWREPMTTSNNDAVATPVWEDDLLLVSGLMFQLDAKTPSAKVLWPEKRGVIQRVLSNTSTPMLLAGMVYSATNRGELVCLDARTGTERWTADQVTDRATGPSIHLTPHLASGTVFLYTNQGDLIQAKLSPEGYEELGRARLLEPVYSFGGRKLTWSPAAYANGHVFARNEKEVVCAALGPGGK